MSTTSVSATVVPVRTQTLASVSRGEIVKLMGPGGIRTWVIAAAVMGIVSGIGAVLLAGIPALQATAPITFPDVITSGPLAVALVLSLAASNYVPREISDGTVMTSKYLVPRSRLLFNARMLAWSVVTVVISLLTSLVAVVAGLISSTIRQSMDVSSFVAMIPALVVSALIVLLAHAGAALLRRGALIVAVGMTVLVVLPLTMTLAAVTTSGIATTVLTWGSKIILGSLLLATLQVPTGPDSSWALWAWSASGVVVWFVATAALGYRAFRSPGYGDS